MPKRSLNALSSDSAGGIVWQHSHRAFGEAEITTEFVSFNVRFPGQYYDSETGLHYNRFRYYNPKDGRYVSADRIGQSGVSTSSCTGYRIPSASLTTTARIHSRYLAVRSARLQQPASFLRQAAREVKRLSLGSQGLPGVSLPGSPSIHKQDCWWLRVSVET